METGELTCFQVDTKDKIEAEKILASIGIDPKWLIQMLYKEIARTGKIPFEMPKESK